MQLYYLNVSDDFSMDRKIIQTLVPAFRLAQAKKYWKERDRNLSVVSYLLWKYVTKDPGNPWSYGKVHKPYVPEGPFFNISHTRGMVACAVSETGEVGVDVERSATGIHDGISELTMSKAEQACIRENPEVFYRFWTLKEAYYKWKGTGITDTLTDLNVSPVLSPKYEASGRGRELRKGSILGGNFVSFKTGGYFLSAFSEKQDVDVELSEITEETLIQWAMNKCR